MSWNTLPPDRKALATERLTPRQLRILQDRLNGHSWRTIATALHIHEATARGHYKAALDRLARKDAA